MSSTSVESKLKYTTYTFAGRKKVINTAVPRLRRTPFQPLYSFYIPKPSQTPANSLLLLLSPTNSLKNTQKTRNTIVNSRFLDRNAFLVLQLSY